MLETSLALAPGKSMRDAAPLKGAENPTNVLALNYDLRATMKGLAASGLLDLSPDLAPVKSAVLSYSPTMWQGFMTARVEKDGIITQGAP